MRFAPHLPWRDEPLAAKLGKRLAGRVLGDVLVDNDANAALWAEARFGAARDVRDAVMLTLGTGIGGAILAGGALHRGRNGMAGEFGHMQVVPDGRPCECGRPGLLGAVLLRSCAGACGHRGGFDARRPRPDGCRPGG